MQEVFHYKTAGLPNVWLQGGVEFVETPYGPATKIENLEDLHRLIAEDIINRPGVMTREEFRFLRRELDVSQRALAGILKTDEKNVSRWETGETKVPGPAAAALGAFYLATTKHDDIAETMKEIAELDREIVEMRTFRMEGDHWETAA
ncbi:hypothetical protein [Roseovarius sp. D22-M7]|uniref:hypothetical protein n=1 Tax=Roseovarius sp. D22-M7 TaxID=3127116 RepID=UPI00300F96E0